MAPHTDAMPDEVVYYLTINKLTNGGHAAMKGS